MAVDRRTLWLGLALTVGLIVAAVVWTSGGSGAAGSGRRATAPRTAPAAKNAEPDLSPGQVNLDALEAQRGQPVDSGRNPFRFRAAPAPPPSGSLLPPRPLNQGPAGPAPPPVPTGPPPPPAIPLKFIGIVVQGNVRVAVLTDGRGAPQPGKEGDTILGQYKILKIGNESIEMSYVDGRGRQTIRLTGQ